MLGLTGARLHADFCMTARSPKRMRACLTRVVQESQPLERPLDFLLTRAFLDLKRKVRLGARDLHDSSIAWLKTESLQLSLE